MLVIEHNLDVIKTADYIIDLGPEGNKGGRIVARGTPTKLPEQRIHIQAVFEGGVGGIEIGCMLWLCL